MRSTDLAKKKVAIVGLGLMGGSLAMALKGKVDFLLGIDPDEGTRQFAEAHQVCDQVLAAVDDTFHTCDLIILAMPVRTIVTFIAALPQLHPGNPIVMDLGSTKSEIMQAYANLPARFDPLGMHPMCGKETSSIRSAEAGLFHGRALIFTRLERTSPHAIEIAEEIAEVLQAVPYWLDPVLHDHQAAAISHLPYLIANALAAVTPLQAAELAGTGYLSTSRIATSDVRMMLDILMTNRDTILDMLEQYQARLARTHAALQEGDETALAALLAEGAAQQHELLDQRRKAGLQ